ncbi:hypothetical protein AHA02nite_09180 [Alkalibacillus haloalkaliphilus]|uniref:Uncharacterized protein n=1 Tax=Alkalibacillus haloalkaliphilus TaxID=94136 RepID=A0A511W711_9BACI|nr:hypothetical protein AHA02nite_09180 [Alkalibacillus haloalkaliphilus]
MGFTTKLKSKIVQQWKYTKTPMGTARAENHPKRHGSEFWEVEAVPMESEVYFHCGMIKLYFNLNIYDIVLKA